jgi:ABC-type transporter Mla MlaB component
MRTLSDSSPELAIDDRGDHPVLEGVLDIRSVPNAQVLLARWRKKPKGRALDVSGLETLDTPGALLLCALRREDVELTGVRPEHRALLDFVCGLDLKPLPALRSVPRWREVVIQLGRGVDQAWHDLLDIVTFVGRSADAIAHLFVHPGDLRLPSISRQVAETGSMRFPSSVCSRS